MVRACARAVYKMPFSYNNFTYIHKFIPHTYSAAHMSSRKRKSAIGVSLSVAFVRRIYATYTFIYVHKRKPRVHSIAIIYQKVVDFIVLYTLAYILNLAATHCSRCRRRTAQPTQHARCQIGLIEIIINGVSTHSDAMNLRTKPIYMQHAPKISVYMCRKFFDFFPHSAHAFANLSEWFVLTTN